MFCRSVRFLREAALVAATFLLPVSPALGGGSYRTSPLPQRASSRPVGSTVRQASLPVTVSIVVPLPTQPAHESLSVDLLGPDGQLRTFPVAGGAAAIQSREVVLRPGESLTIQWKATK